MHLFTRLPLRNRVHLDPGQVRDGVRGGGIDAFEPPLHRSVRTSFLNVLAPYQAGPDISNIA